LPQVKTRRRDLRFRAGQRECARHTQTTISSTAVRHGWRASETLNASNQMILRCSTFVARQLFTPETACFVAFCFLAIDPA
jgi:hypothetical protein